MQDLCTVINQVNKRVHRLPTTTTVQTPPKVDSKMWQKIQLAIKMTNKKQDRKQQQQQQRQKKKVASWQNNIGQENTEQENGNGREQTHGNTKPCVCAMTTTSASSHSWNMRSIFINVVVVVVAVVVPGIVVETFHFSLHFHMGHEDQEEQQHITDRQDESDEE